MKLDRDLRRVVLAGGLAVAAGPGCFFFSFCDPETHTRTETRTVTGETREWFTTTPPGGPFTASWRDVTTTVLAGPAGGARSRDGGLTWEPLSEVPAGLAALDAADADELWMVGAAGLVGVRSDGVFTAGASGTDADLVDVARYAGAGGVAVGADGTLLTSRDGLTWAADADVAALVAAEGGGALLAVDLLSDGTIWVAAEAGLLLHRGGAGWEVVDLDTTADLRDISFASVNRGLVAGEGGAAWFTVDAGVTWTSAPAPGDVTALSFSGPEDDAVRWAGGPDGVVWSFDGSAWQEAVADTGPIATIATADGLGIAAGPGVAATVYGWVEHTTNETFEVNDCPEYE